MGAFKDMAEAWISKRRLGNMTRKAKKADKLQRAKRILHEQRQLSRKDVKDDDKRMAATQKALEWHKNKGIMARVKRATSTR